MKVRRSVLLAAAATAALAAPAAAGVPFEVTAKCTYTGLTTIDGQFLVAVAGVAASGPHPAAATIIECTLINGSGSWTTDGVSATNIGVTQGVFLVPIDGPFTICATARAIPQDLGQGATEKVTGPDCTM